MSDCPSIKCCSPDDFRHNITSGRVYENLEGSFVIECPVGYNCANGEYPKTIIIPAGEKTWIPDDKDTDDHPQTLYLECCSGTLSAVVPMGATQAEFDAIVQQLLQDWAAAEAACKGAPGHGLLVSIFTNVDQFLDICGDGETLINNGAVVPASMLIVGNGLVVLQGFYSGATKDIANQNAYNAGMSWIVAALASGMIECSSGPWTFENLYDSLNATSTLDGPGGDISLEWTTIPAVPGGEGGGTPEYDVVDCYACKDFGPYPKNARITVTLQYNIPIGSARYSVGTLKAGFITPADPLNRCNDSTKPTTLSRSWSPIPYYGDYSRGAWTLTQQDTIPMGEIRDWKIFVYAQSTEIHIPIGSITVSVDIEFELDEGGYSPIATLPAPIDGVIANPKLNIAANSNIYGGNVTGGCLSGGFHIVSAGNGNWDHGVIRDGGGTVAASDYMFYKATHPGPITCEIQIASATYSGFNASDSVSGVVGGEWFIAGLPTSQTKVIAPGALTEVVVTEGYASISCSIVCPTGWAGCSPHVLFAPFAGASGYIDAYGFKADQYYDESL